MKRKKQLDIDPKLLKSDEELLASLAGDPRWAAARRFMTNYINVCKSSAFNLKMDNTASHLAHANYQGQAEGLRYFAKFVDYLPTKLKKERAKDGSAESS